MIDANDNYVVTYMFAKIDLNSTEEFYYYNQNGGLDNYLIQFRAKSTPS